MTLVSLGLRGSRAVAGIPREDENSTTQGWGWGHSEVLIPSSQQLIEVSPSLHVPRNEDSQIALSTLNYGSNDENFL